jgi:hypothetical protein
MLLKLACGLVALILGCVGFQLFLRSEYVANGTGAVVRVDRLTGTRFFDKMAIILDVNHNKR